MASIARARLLGCALEEIADDLERILAGLGPHTPDGPCDAACGCLTDAPAAPVALTLTSAPLACTLNAAEMPRTAPGVAEREPLA